MKINKYVKRGIIMFGMVLILSVLVASNEMIAMGLLMGAVVISFGLQLFDDPIEYEYEDVDDELDVPPVPPPPAPPPVVPPVQQPLPVDDPAPPSPFQEVQAPEVKVNTCKLCGEECKSLTSLKMHVGYKHYKEIMG